MTKRSRKLLDGLSVDYEYTNIDNDPAGASWVREQNSDDKEHKPTIKVGGEVLIEPSDDELSKALKTGGYVN